jgi:Zn-dependent M28 family amino/carboxypeptidase
MRFGRPISLSLFVCLSLVGCAADKTPVEAISELSLPEGVDIASAAIDEPTLLSIIETLSSDELEGRGPSTAGDLAARRYMAETLEGYGMLPAAADGSWEQPIGLVSVEAVVPPTWTFEHENGSIAFDWDADFIASSGVQDESAAVENAELVFVGYGITAPEEDWDDYKGLNVAGKVLVMLNNDPEDDPNLFAGSKRLFYGRWTYKYESAKRQGAAGAIIIHTEHSAGYGWNVIQSSWTGPQYVLPATDGPKMPLEGWLTDGAAHQLFALGGHDLDAMVAAAQKRDFQPQPLGITTSLAFTNKIERDRTSANVLGMLKGSDPELADQFVVYTAHHDHLGVGAPNDEGDAIYNGARDNGSGVASILAIAKAFAALPEPPRRSVLFLFVGAEEQGLLGSKLYSENPTVHPGKMAANINLDSAAIFGRAKDVAVVGKGKSNLEQLLVAAAEKQDRVVVDEPFPDKGYYYRSDQFNFAKIGVPALYFKAGTDSREHGREWGEDVENRWRAERYHQVDDEIYDEWDFGGMIEDAQLAFWVGLHVANADELPAWTPGDEFEAIREQALSDASE